MTDTLHHRKIQVPKNQKYDDTDIVQLTETMSERNIALPLRKHMVPF